MLVFVLTLAVLLPTNAHSNDFLIGITSNFHSFQPYFNIKINKLGTSKEAKFQALENHHLYWGSIVLLSGVMLKSKSAKRIGTLIVVDDLIQHTFRVESPLHLLNNTLGKWKTYREFTNSFGR
jgi:hypothetical protein